MEAPRSTPYVVDAATEPTGAGPAQSNEVTSRLGTELNRAEPNRGQLAPRLETTAPNVLATMRTSCTSDQLST